MNNEMKYVLIAGGVVIALYAVNQGAETVAGGVANGAEYAGAGVGLAAVVGAVLLFAL